MATIYTGIYQKLKSSQTPWPDKLKLARFALVSKQCLLPKKEQVLLDWIVNALSCYYNKKAEVPFEVVESLWTYLDEILHSQRIKHILSQGKNISLSPAVSQIIVDRVLEASSGTLSVSLSTVLSCCQGILSSPVLSVSFTARYDVLVQLLVKVCGLACSQLSRLEESPEPLSLNVFEVLLLVLSSYLTVQKQQGNSKRVFTQVAEHLLQPLCLLRHLLSSRTWSEKDDPRIRQNLNKDIRSKVDMVLQSSLFFDDRLPCYKEELLPPERETSSKKGKNAGNILFCPVAKILSKLVGGHGSEKEALFYGVRCSSLPLLFKFALDSFGKDDTNKLVCFHIMTKFITALDLTDDLKIKETFNPQHWSIVLLSLESMLNSCLAGDIYNVASDRINHSQVQLTFYRKIAQLLLSNAQTDKPAWYRCLKTLLALNHLILEPDLDELVSSAWIDADNRELRVKKARETLVSEVLRTYAKLRQLPRLIEEVLVVIMRPAADELRQELLPEAVRKTLSQCLLDNPASQNLDICRRILEAIQRELPYVKEMRTESALKLLSLSVPLHVVIFSLKTVDDSTPVPVVRQTQSLMEQMFSLVGSLIEYLEGLVSTDTLWNNKIQEFSLLLTYTWHEADSLFKNHCSKYTSPAGASTEVCPVSDTIKKVRKALKGLTGPVCSSPLSRLLQKLLALHEIKKHLLVSPLPVLNTQDTGVHKILCKAARFVVNKQEDSLINLNTDQTWDLQLCSVNNATYSVAYWFLVTTNLPLLAPYLSQEDVSYIADAMLNSLLQSDLESNPQQTDLSVFLISKQLLESRVLCELPALYSALVKSITSKLLGHTCISDIQSLCPTFFKPCTEFSVESVDRYGRTFEITPSLQRLKAIAQEIMGCVEAGVSVQVSQTQVESLLQMIKIASFLDPHAMSPDDYSELYLSTFVMQVCVQSVENGGHSAPINLLQELFGFTAWLLSGQNSHVVLRAVHGSAILEATMNSIFSCFNKGLFHDVDTTAWFPFLQSLQGFIQSLIQLVLTRKSSVVHNLEKITNVLIEKLAVGGPTALDLGEYEVALYVQLHLVTLSTLCKEMIGVLGKKKQLDLTLVQLLEKIVFKMGPAIQAVLSGKASSVLQQSLCIDVVTEMLKSELAVASHKTATEDISESDGSDGSDKLSRMAFYKNFGQQILKELCPVPRPIDLISSSIHYLSAFYMAAETTTEMDLGELNFTVLQSVHKLLSGAWLSISEVKELEEPIKNLLAHLMASCTQEQFHLLFLLLQDGLVASKIESGNHTETLASLTLIKLLACCALPDTCSEKFWLTVPQILSSLVLVIRESSAVPSLTSVLTVPAVETMITLLRQGESQLSNPHHIILGLSGLQFVPLDSRSIDDYYSAFQAVHEFLFTLYMCYPLVMLKAAPAFLNCFHRLVTSIIHEGRQRNEKEKERDSETLLKCAMLVERMYSNIGSTVEGFTGLAPFIVAQYVCELQKVTLKPEIKAHLTEGIYRVLNLCSEKAIKFLNMTLPAGVKEVFSELYKNYTHYHKPRMYGEQKYSA